MNSKFKFLTKALVINFLLMFTMSGYAGIFSGWGNYDPYYGQCPSKCKRPYIYTLNKCERVARLDNCGYVKSISTFDRCDKKYKTTKYKKCGKCAPGYRNYWSWF